MSHMEAGQWQPMERAPKDGTRVLVEVRAGEQGPAEVDVARWGRPDKTSEPTWIAADSDPGCIIIYAEAELVGWMPLPSPLPRLRSAAAPASPRPNPNPEPSQEEIGGSGI